MIPIHSFFFFFFFNDTATTEIYTLSLHDALPIHFLAVVLGHGLDNSIARADIVKQEISVGMKLFVRQGGRNGESAAVQRRARGGGGQRLDVTLLAAHFCEQLGAFPGLGGRSKLRVACGSLSGTDEAGEMIDVGEAVGPRLVIGFPNRDRKSTRLNSSHGYISYAVFCLKKKKKR